jgi:hypothetical protein
MKMQIVLTLLVHIDVNVNRVIKEMGHFVNLCKFLLHDVS